MTRLHVRRMEAVETQVGDGSWRLVSPSPGLFEPSIAAGAHVARGEPIGTLVVLGSRIELVTPRAGYVNNAIGTDLTRNSLERQLVAYGDALLILSQHDLRGGTETDAAAAAIEAQQRGGGPVFRAPTSGRYYGRPGPDKPAFVTVGAELATGTTICLLEVMKTFNRITYDGERARVKELLVAEGADVNAGDPLLALEPLP